VVCILIVLNILKKAIGVVILVNSSFFFLLVFFIRSCRFFSFQFHLCFGQYNRGAEDFDGIDFISGYERKLYSFCLEDLDLTEDFYSLALVDGNSLS
jgi:hypothetical protein